MTDETNIQHEITNHATIIQRAILEAQQDPSYKHMSIDAQLKFINNTICIKLCKFANTVIDMTLKV